jgi:lipoprotein-releasing system permease protein
MVVSLSPSTVNADAAEDAAEFGLVKVGGGLALERYRLIALDPAVYFIDHLPIRLAAGDVLLVVAVSVLVSVLATLHPARAAARLMPVEAIRGV